MTTTARKKHLAAVQGLITDSSQILDGRIGDQYAVDKAQEFSAGMRHLLRVFHSELPEGAVKSTDAQILQLLTEDQAEGERLMGRSWITNVWGQQEPCDPIKRRFGIDLQSMREATEWLRVLADKLALSSGVSGAPLKRDPTLVDIRKRIRALREVGDSFKKIRERLDQDGISLPPGNKWGARTWSLAHRKQPRTVTSWMSKAAHSTR